MGAVGDEYLPGRIHKETIGRKGIGLAYGGKPGYVPYQVGVMKLSVSHHGGTRYDIVSGKHRLVTDQPVEDGGKDAGPNPVELFVGSLASCVAYFVGRFCTRHEISREGLNVEAEWAMAENPHRVGRVDLAIRLPHRLTPEMKERLLKVAHGCTVHQSLVIAPTVGITLA